MANDHQSVEAEGTRQDAIDELLDRWEDLKRSGAPPSVAELCGERTDLISDVQQRIAELEKIGALLEEEGGILDAEVPDESIPHEEVALTLRLNELSLFDFGGMGIVGHAKDSELRRDVAVKFMKPSNNSPVNQERFLNEAKVTGRMAHPGVLPVYGFGRTPDNLPFYAMRYVSGPTFEEAINDYHREKKNQRKRQQTLGLRKLLTHFISVAYTIAYAHERGVVHCDLKPQNILLGAFGETYVIDWGLAVGVSPSKGKFTGVAERGEAHGAGTEGYCHPDQLSGAALPNRAWDIYSLGAVLYRLLTSRVTTDSRVTVPKGGDQEPSTLVIRRPCSVDKTIPPALESICFRALGRDGEYAYERASEVADDVQRYLAGEPVAGHTETIAERVLRWQRSHQGATKIAGILLIMLISVLLVSSFSLWRFAAARKVNIRESLETAVKFAAQTVALEMSNRWQALNLASRDPRLLAGLQNAEDDSEPVISSVLQARIKYHRNAFKTLRSDSWFLCNAEGRQVARSPVSNRSIGNNYGHRDYFHGNGRDFAETASGEPLPGDPPYIEQPHHSVVYQSTSDNSLKVAYSVPVFVNPGTDEEEFVGVIGMSVKLGGFSILNDDMLGNHHLILVDLRDDWLEGQAVKGLILHHPNLGELVQDSQRDPGRSRLSEDLVIRLLTLRSNDPSFYLEDFVDPVSGSKRGSLASFAKVTVKNEGESPRDSGWAVIVMEDQDSTGWLR
ncbi:MAG: Serine/threonine-protein kinase PknD [Verrucomicrobia subdivision 3 bacterium]|nr:Serine/threonine-protein kinase PknD [Limisphaerales bacterium]MCS1415067.1 Serine/threonine-protein kinase PknD [Limisphaerales bacterium]